MNPTLQLEEAIQVYDPPKLLVEWSSPWHEFVTSIRPGLTRSTARLAGETPFGLIPGRIMLLACAIEAFLIFVAIVLPVKIEQLRPQAVPKLASHDIIYYSGDELPRTEDLGGAQAGTSGKSGGKEAHHRTQTIRVARGHSLIEKVVDAPNLKLQASHDAVANLLAIRPNAGPPPTEGLRTSRNSPNLTTTLIAPAPEVIREYSRTRTSLGTVIPPAPSVSHDSRSLPSLNSTVIAPAPEVSHSRLVAPALNTSVIAPAPDVSHQSSRSAQSLATNVIPPAPGTVSGEVSRTPVQMTNAAVVPPPVSAPERETRRTSRLTVPAPSVIAPPPTADMSRDLRRLAGNGGAVPSQSVVPPPPTTSNGGSFMGSLIGKIFGPTEVVPPPTTSSGSGGNRTAALNQNVVLPPTAVTGGSSGTSRGSALNTSVVPPPPTTAGTNRGANASGRESGTLLASNIIPPPPSVANAGASSGQGNRGTGRGAPLDIGSVAAPPASGGSGGSTAAVISAQPGNKIALPNNGAAGSLAMSPTGADKPGLGGAGGGWGISHGKDSGSSMTGAGPGAAKTGTDRGSDPNAHNGISPTPGHGGAGSGTSGTPPAPGVSVAGGSSIVTVTIGSDVGSGGMNLPGRSSVRERQDLRVSIQSTSSSGGAFDFYHLLPGATHTFYIENSPLPAVMTYSDPVSASPNHPYSGSLIDPAPIHNNLPAGLPRAPLAIYCTLDASGNLKNLRVIQAGPPDMTAKVMAALPSWKFSPAMVGNQPVEVNAILGFNIDTNDR